MIFQPGSHLRAVFPCGRFVIRHGRSKTCPTFHVTRQTKSDKARERSQAPLRRLSARSESAREAVRTEIARDSPASVRSVSVRCQVRNRPLTIR
jgi:hypothetical protein